MSTDHSCSWILAAAAVLAAVLIYVVPLGNWHLMEPDEGRYAEIPREMIESGDYVTPRLNYVKYFEKPALLYWLNAAGYRVFGQNEFAARFPSALAALGGALAAGLFAGRIYGRRAGVLSGIITATSMLYFAVGRINITDMPMSFFLTLALAAFYAGCTGGNRKWYLLFYAAMGLGVLTKGLIGVVLPAGVIFWYAVFTRKWRLFREVFYLPGIVLFLVIAVPWFYKVCSINSDFFHFFFIREHFLRYLTKMHGRYQPFWFFLPLIPAGMLPWTGFLFSLFSRESVVRSPQSGAEKDACVFLLLWFGVIFLFFSCSGSKLIPYIVPCLPPLAILIGADISRMVESGKLHGGVFFWNAAIAVVFSAALAGYALTNHRFSLSQTALPAALISAGILTIPCGLFKILRRRTAGGESSLEKMPALLCLAALIFLLGLQPIFPLVASTRSSYEVSRTVLKEKQDGDTIAVYGEVLQGLPFYTRSRVMLVDYLGELEFGAGHAEGKGWFPGRDEFLAEWNAGKRPFVLVVRKKRLKELFPGGPGSGVKIVSSGKYDVLIKREAAKQNER